MKRGRNTAEEFDESGLDPAAKRIAQDTTIVGTADVSVQPWTEMLTSILGVDEPHYGNDTEVHLNDVVDVISVPVHDIGPEASLGRPNLEEVGRRIETWAEATMTQYTKAQRQDDEIWQPSIGDMDDPDNDPMQCFGMIHECRIRLYGDMPNLRHKLARICSTKRWAQLQFITASDTGFLKLDDGTLCAQLDHHLYDPLKRITQIESTRLRAYVLVEEWIGIIDHAKRHKDAETNIDINVYGLSSVRSAVGQKLSDDGLYLQHTKHCEEDVKYENPHMLAYEDVDQNDYDMEVDNMEVDNMDLKNWRPEDVQQTLVEVCLAETKDRHFREEQGYMHITVPLLPHQKQAVPFMVEREVGPITDDANLWKWTEDETRSGFRHRITGCWATEPRLEVGGGILADDPGMGKTLSTLSLIGRRLADAQAWSQSHDEEHKTNSRTSVRSKATLVVVPSLPIMIIWLTQIETFMDSSLKVLKYHGRFRCKQVKEIAEADIVFTTYHTLAAERKSKKNSLKSINWFRIVLDEAHYIRRQTTTLYAAVAELDACHRWCLTGTPVQNKLDDLGALLAFIRADPFDNISVFRKYIVSPSSYDLGAVREKLSLLLNSVCMRRRIERLDLPSTVERCHYVELSEAEQEQYKTTRDSMFWELSHGSQEKYSGTPFGKFQIQLQLRRLCNHGTFQKPWASGHIDVQAQREDIVSSIGKDSEVMCSSCHEWIPILATNCDASRTLQACSQVLCDECITELSEIAKAPMKDSACIVNGESCSHPTGWTLGKSLKESDVGFQGYSSKMERLMRDVSDDLASTKRWVTVRFSSWYG
jgi:SWI/SNF-related matrix-associated actin-dependent regulator of chromatin subfamily A3